jgi:outer membrane protein assembly factor BamD
MPNFTRSAAVLAGCAALLPLTGCAHFRKHGGDTAYVARDVNTLYAAAQRMMDNRDYDTAAKLFDEVERQHPYSVWARRAQIMSAFNYYLAQKYTESISSAQRFLTIHPGNSEAPYAHYLVAMSYYQQIEEVNRDQATTQQALAAFNELIRLYPETRYASDARLKLDLINDHLAGKEMEIGRFYQRSGEWLAASLRFRKVVDDYQTTSHTPEALERLVECYLALGIPQEADKAAAVLGRNYNGTYWYKQAYTLIARKTPRAARQTIVPAPTPAAAPAPAPTPMPAPPQG